MAEHMYWILHYLGCTNSKYKYINNKLHKRKAPYIYM